MYFCACLSYTRVSFLTFFFCLLSNVRLFLHSHDTAQENSFYSKVVLLALILTWPHGARNVLSYNPPYGKRCRLYILQQFLSNLTWPITHKVIFWGEGVEGEIRPCNSNIVYPRFEVYKTFLCIFMSNFMAFMR